MRLGLAAGCFAAALAWAQPPAAPAGDTARGRVLFATTYKCYACHGYSAQTGERRLVPMRLTQEAFTAFVQNSTLPQMPSFPDMSNQALADVYAYLRSISVDAPPLDEVPLLEDIRVRTREAMTQ
jgi:mono/diheme cytochrome c family protein